ncbi:MAG: hypothetical protein Q8R55_03635 [Candidatus Taylorbacteria bacterium]|nr:hypothetical protein [Candidatus Taylorbacteria bacterium]
MKLHLLAIPRNYPKSTATACCGRTYEEQGPRQPEDKTRVTTVCGKETYFRGLLNEAIQSGRCDVSLCNACLQKISTLPEKEKSRVLIVVRKSLDDKLEDWEAQLASDEEAEQRIDVRVFRLGVFDLSSVAYLTGLNREKVKSYLTKLIDNGILVHHEDQRLYQMADNHDKLMDFANRVVRSLQDDRETHNPEEEW